MKCFSAILLTSVIAILTEVTRTSAFEQLTNKNFAQNVHEKPTAWLVAFDGPDGPSEKVFEDIEERLKSYGIQSGTVDCSDESNKKICLGANLKAIPTFQLYLDLPVINPYTKKKTRMPISHTGRASAKSVESFVAKSFSSYVRSIAEIAHFDQHMSNTTGPVAVFCTSHEPNSIPMILKSIAYVFGNQVKFLHVHNESTVLLSHVGITDTAKLIIRSNGQVSVYEGSLGERDSVISWISGFVPKNGDSSEPDAASKTAAAAEDRLISSRAALDNIIKTEVDHMYIIAVVKSSAEAEVPEWKSKIEHSSEGAVRIQGFPCNNREEPDSEIANHICETFVKTSKPFLLVVPYGSSLRSKFKSSLSKWMFETSEFDKAKVSALESLPESYITPLSDASMNMFMGSATQEEKMGVIVFSEKVTPSLMLRHVSVLFKKVAKIGFYPNPPARLLGEFGNPPVPSLVALFPDLSKTDIPDQSVAMKVNVFNPKQYGPIRFDSMSDFILQSYMSSGLLEKHGDPFGISRESDQSSVGRAQIVLHSIESEANWKESCGNDFRGLCAILFVNGNDSSAEATSATFSEIAGNLGANAAAFKFMVVDAVCQPSFADVFDVQDNKLPTVVAYSPSKDRYALMRAAYSDRTAVKDFLIAVASGKSSTQPISMRPSLQDQCEVTEEYVDTPMEGSDDFLEEIRKEEEERAKRVSKEADEERKRLLEEKAKKDKQKDGGTKKKKKGKKGNNKAKTDEL